MSGEGGQLYSTRAIAAEGRLMEVNADAAAVQVQVSFSASIPATARMLILRTCCAHDHASVQASAHALFTLQRGRAACRGGAAGGPATTAAGTSASSSGAHQRGQQHGKCGASVSTLGRRSVCTSLRQHGADAPGTFPGSCAAAHSRVWRKSGAGGCWGGM